jgi:putative endonuclease
VRLPFRTAKPIATGKAAEDFAAAYLRARGMDIRARNHRCRGGEIDLIAQCGELLVFVEVRLRNHRRFASGAQSVDHRKQQRLVQAASHYLQQQHGANPPPCRFDVISMAAKGDNGREYDVEWLQDAFRPEN